MDADKISKYRSAIMGFAIFWIMVYHSEMSFGFIPILGKAVNYFGGAGYGGVDIFLFVSGFGLFRSLSQNPNQLDFYKRRLKRLLPAYVPVLAVWLFLNRYSISPTSWPWTILGNLTGISFWMDLNPSFNWYMLALFSFYFIAPFYFRAIKRPHGFGGIIAATLVLDICFYDHSVMVAISRFTIFAIGMAFGRRAAEGRKVNRHLELFIYAAGAFGCCLLLIFRKSFSIEHLWYGGFYWYPYIFIAPALVLLLCRLFSWMEHRVPRILYCFEATGKYSFEIYLIHIVAFDYIHLESDITWPFIYVAMVLCGYVYHTVLAKIMACHPADCCRKRRK